MIKLFISKPLSGKCTWVFCFYCIPLNLLRLMTRIGGLLNIWNFLTACLCILHLLQNHVFWWDSFSGVINCLKQSSIVTLSFWKGFWLYLSAAFSGKCLAYFLNLTMFSKRAQHLLALKEIWSSNSRLLACCFFCGVDSKALEVEAVAAVVVFFLSNLLELVISCLCWWSS